MSEGKNKKRSLIDEALIAANLGEYINNNVESQQVIPKKEATSKTFFQSNSIKIIYYYNIYENSCISAT